VPFCAAGESFYTDGWSGPAPAGWQIELESTMFKMRWGGLAVADEASDVLPLGPEHAVQAMALA